MIKEESSKHFDPVIVEAFCASWEDFLDVRANIDESKPQLVGIEESISVRC